MTPAEIIQRFQDDYDEILTLDGFDDALLGIVVGAYRQPVACYDHRKCVEILMKRDGMDEEMAEEWMDFNVTGAYLGELTPLFVHIWRDDGDLLQVR